MAYIKKIKEGTETIYPATIPQAVVDPTSGKSVRTELDEKATSAELVQLAGDVNRQYSGITASLQKGSLAVKKIETSQNIKNVVEGRRTILGNFVADANFRNQLIEIDHSKCYRLRTPNLSSYANTSSFCMFDQNDALLDVTANAVDGYFIFNQSVKSVAIVSSLSLVGALLAETLEYREVSLEVVSELGVSESKVSSQKLVNDVYAEIKQDIADIKEGYELDVNFEALNSVVTPVFTAGVARGGPFRGHGANFNKVGVSFNAIRGKNFRRISDVPDDRKWQYIRLIVKNSPTDETILAASPYMKIDSSLLTIPELIFPLLDPSTNEVITLDDENFSGTEYFIGYLYCNALKEYAHGGNMTGTQANYAGASFYTTAPHNGINSTNWTTLSGNPCVPFEHLLLSDVDVKLKMSDVLDLTERVEVLENEAGYGVEIVLPAKYVAVVGSPIQLFYHGLIKSVNAYKYNIVVNCVKGKDFRRYWEFTPVIGDIGTHSFTLFLYNDAGILISTATTQIEVVEFVQNPAVKKNILTVGDSLNNEAGDWGDAFAKQVVDGTNILPGLSPISNIDFVGEDGVAPKQYTGQGGWSWSSYNLAPNPATADIWVYATHDKDASDQESLWSDANSNIWQLETIESTRLKFKRYGGHTANMPTAPNALTHNMNATHTASINYTSTQVAEQNPFWNAITSKVDFVNWFSSKYPTKHSAGEGIDACFVMLGWNGGVYGKLTPANWDNYILTAKTFIDNLHADYPSCKIYVMGLQYPSLNGGLGNNYGAGANSYAELWSVIQSVQSLNKAYEALCADAIYSSFCKFINISGQFDSEFNMPYLTTPVNLRSSITERRGNNGVHPSAEGYMQISDAAIRMLIKEFCQ